MTHSARSLIVAPALRTHPSAGVIVPLVACVRNGTQRCLDVVPSPVVVKAPADQSRDECTASSRPCPAIQVLDKIVVQLYVYSHVL